MKIDKINLIQHYNNTNINNKEANNIQQKNISTNINSTAIMSQLEGISAINKLPFTGKQKYELGLSSQELMNRTTDEALRTYKLLSVDSPEYQNLAEGDKIALKHLVKAAQYIGEVELKLDDENNIPFRNYLQKEIKKGNIDAEMTLKLFEGQKGIFANDLLFNKISLVKDLKQSPTRGFYPRNIDAYYDFQVPLLHMLNMGGKKNLEEVQKILSARTIVKQTKDGRLKAIDYVDAFKTEFSKAADELEKAAKHSTHEGFNKYLKLQAKALRTADPMLDAQADKQWATLQDTPLEFTITRENYEDGITGTVFENKALAQALECEGITPIAKDNLGARVGIVNKKGTEFLLKSKELLPILAELMPFKDEYEQNINEDNKQTMVDVDLVDVAGDVGEYRSGITVAENLPNNDKLSLQIGGGRRNVYHRQIRMGNTKNDPYKELLDPEQRKYLSADDKHYFTVGHENGHSLGPSGPSCEKLGKYKNIIEENKADLVAASFVDKLTSIGFYSLKQREGILINFVLNNFLKAKPDMSQAHRVRQVMQCKYLEENGAFEFSKDGKLHVNTDKVVPACKKMLEQVIRIQIDGDIKAAEKFVDKYFVWTDDMEKVAQYIQKHSKALNGRVETPLADFLKAQ